MKKIFITTLLLFFTFFYSKTYSSELDIKAKTVILQDYLSGEILYEKEADLKIFPASMTKIMTSIIAFDLIKQGRLSLDEKFFVSEKCLEAFPSWLLINVYNGWRSNFCRKSFKRYNCIIWK